MVECIYNDNKELHSNSSNVKLINVATEHILWIKENLLNIALKNLPPSAKYIVWCDADIFF